MDKEKKTTEERIKIAQKYAKALTSGKSNPKYGIDMKGKGSLSKYGLTDNDEDGVVDNYISVFESARNKAKEAQEKADAIYTKYGGKINKKGEVTKEAKMTDKQQKEYEKAAAAAERLWKRAESINDVTNDYQDTMAQIAEDQETILEYQQQMEDLAISTFETALEATDKLKELKDLGAEIKGWKSGFSTDSPFRSLIEDGQRLSDMMRDDSFDINGFYDDNINKLKEQQAQYKKGTKEYQAYEKEITFNEEEKQKFLTDAYGVGTGELAQAMMHFNQLDHWFNEVSQDEDVANLAMPYGDDSEDLLKQYEDYYKQFAGLVLEWEERIEAMQKDAVAAMEESMDRQEKVLEKFDKVQKDLDRTSKRVALWQGEDAYADQAAISKQKAATAKAAAEARKSLYDTWASNLKAQKELEDKNRAARMKTADAEVKRLDAKLKKFAEGSADYIETNAELQAAKVAAERAKTDYSEAVDTLQKEVDEMWEEIQDDQDTAAEAMKEAYLAEIDEINAALTQTLFGSRDLDDITNN